MKQQVISLIKNQAKCGICFTTDNWRACNYKSFMKIICHFMDTNFSLQQRVLATREFLSNHNTNNIATLFLKILTEYQIEYKQIQQSQSKFKVIKQTLKIFYLQINQILIYLLQQTKLLIIIKLLIEIYQYLTSTVLLTYKIMYQTNFTSHQQKKHKMPLIKNKLNLQINIKIQQDKQEMCLNIFGNLQIIIINQLIFKQKTIRRNNNKRTLKLKHKLVALMLTQKQKNQNLTQNYKAQNQQYKPLKLNLDICTRWKSQFLMLQRFNVLSDSIQQYIKFNKEDSHLINGLDYKSNELLIKFLQQFYEITQALSSRSQNCFSKALKLIQTIQNVYLKQDSNDIPIIAHLKILMIQKFNKQIDKIIDSREEKICYFVCSFLNPRTKDLKLLESKDKEYTLNFIDVFGFSDDDSMAEQILHQPSEMENYVNYKQKFNANFYLLDCWRQNKNAFPVISILARKYLCLQLASIESEHVLSKAGSIITNQRSNLKSSNSDKLVFISQNCMIFSLLSSSIMQFIFNLNQNQKRVIRVNFNEYKKFFYFKAKPSLHKIFNEQTSTNFYYSIDSLIEIKEEVSKIKKINYLLTNCLIIQMI